eukprot:CAMPEP_0170591332 /NCGR_PEP_ID=MMETSP0224-20130122/12348_1 /TAXON_ID=285029 /ORGANISM="Togula jolla, Strain CCCM 725" /LENGTH=739 /DNA_ID=CAMNT_0010915191 /DNA_START=44 /DNA_END=2263 /DNA_ORIENTATION=+
MKNFACLFLLAGLIATSASAAKLTSNSSQRVGSPLEKVVQLLQDLEGRLQQDEKEEKLAYDKYACWCEKTSSRKAAAIERAQAELRELGQRILAGRGAVAVLSAEISKLTEEIKANKAAQQEATSVREEQHTAFAAETDELKQALTALEKAIDVLRSGTKPSSLLQQGSRAAQEAVKAAITALPRKVVLKPEQLSLLGSLTSASSSSQSEYMPQSLTVQGILIDMYATFSADVESSTSREASAQREFESFIHVKQEEKAAMEELRTKKEGEKAEKEELLASDSATYDDTEREMKEAQEFFDATKAACLAKHDEWSTRQQLRSEELAGVKEALKILTSDEARELFRTTIKAGKETGVDTSYDSGMKIDFLQLSSDVAVASQKPEAARAYKVLKSHATRSHSLRLAALAVQIHETKVGHFDKVLKAIDTMIETLKQEDKDDIAKRDQCKELYTQLASETKDVKWKIEKNLAKIDKLNGLIELRTADKAQTIEEIAEVTTQMQEMTEQRTAENLAFKHAKSEDQAAVTLLLAAREALSKYYKNNDVAMGPIQGDIKGLSLEQVSQPDFDIDADQAPEAKFSSKGHRKRESKGVVSILTMLIEDINDEIKNGMKDEETAQKDYETAYQAAEALKESLVQKKVNLEETIANLNTEKNEEEETMGSNKAYLKGKTEHKAEITPDCDWMLGAFEKRAAARAEEMQGLVGAKEYLAGLNQEALLQKGSPAAFDDQALSRAKFLSLSP